VATKGCSNEHSFEVPAANGTENLSAEFAANKRYALVVQLLYQLNGIDVELRIGCEGFHYAEIGTLTGAPCWPVCYQFPVNMIARMPEQVARLHLPLVGHELTKIREPPTKHWVA
jgi:hypothetical protein